jgi:hypothetical protein
MLAAVLVLLLPSCPWRCRRTTGSSHGRPPGPTLEPTQASSHELSPSFRERRSPSGLRIHDRPRSTASASAPPVEFCPLQRIPARSSGNQLNGLSTPERLRLQVFSTSWRVDPPRACWPCFMPDPLMGFALQSFAPPVQPYAVSDAHALLSLERSSDPPEDHRARRRRLGTAPGLDDPHSGLAIKTPPAFRALLHTRVRHFEPAV